MIVAATLTPVAVDSTVVVEQWRFSVGSTPVTDACSNVLLFVPFGMTVAFTMPVMLATVWRRAAWATVAGVLLSVCIEWLQSQGVPPGRFATIADVMANGTGALIGALIAVHHDTLARPSPKAARRLAIGWTVGAASALLSTGWLLSANTADVHADTVQRASVTPSALPNAPGFPWFAGLVERVRVVGVPIGYVGTGPVRVEARWTSGDDAWASAHASNELMLTVRGRNPLGGIYPLLFIHEPGRRTFAAMIAQRDRDLVMQTARRGDGAGVRMPLAVISRAFDGLADAHGIEFGAPTDPRLHVRAIVSRAELSLAVHSAFVHPARIDSVRLLMTPALGWMLVLAAPVDRVWAQQLATVCWLLLMMAPACFWSWRSRRGAVATLAVVLALALACAVAPWLLGIALLPWWQWAALFAGALTGVLFSRYTQHATHHPSVAVGAD